MNVIVLERYKSVNKIYLFFSSQNQEGLTGVQPPIQNQGGLRPPNPPCLAPLVLVILHVVNGDINTILLTQKVREPSFHLTGDIISLPELWLPCSRVFIFTGLQYQYAEQMSQYTYL